MKKLTVTEMRRVLNTILIDLPDLQKKLSEMTDDQLLEANLCDEFDIDSIDFEDMLCALDTYYGFSVDFSEAKKYSFFENPTVKNFIQMCNDS